VPELDRARNWINLPSRVAMLLGIGVLATGGARAETTVGDAAVAAPHPPQAIADDRAGLSVWASDGRIYLADPRVRELQLSDTPEARRLHDLLRQRGATDMRSSVRLDRLLLAGGGGDGFHWAPPRAGSPGRRAVTEAAEPGSPIADRQFVRDAHRTSSSTVATPKPHRDEQ
jgi:hypothetical protein